MGRTFPLATFSACASFQALEFFRSFRGLVMLAQRIKFIVSYVMIIVLGILAGGCVDRV